MRANVNQKCLVPECKNIAVTRGLCNSCYSYARKLVSRKQATWEQLEKNGKILPKNSQDFKMKWFLGE